MAEQTVYGIVANRAAAEKCIQALINSGIANADISFLSSQGEQFKEFTNIENRDWRKEDRVTGKGTLGTEKHTKAPEGATTGMTTGGLIGGTLGLLAGLGALAIPGVGPFIAAGPIMAALSGLGAGGAIGGIIGGLIGWGIPEYEAKRYENSLKAGGVLLAVCCLSDDLAKKVKDILIHNGAEDVNISSSATASKNYHNKH
jgi:hypothetical protein